MFDPVTATRQQRIEFLRLMGDIKATAYGVETEAGHLLYHLDTVTDEQVETWQRMLIERLDKLAALRRKLVPLSGRAGLTPTTDEPLKGAAGVPCDE